MKKFFKLGCFGFIGLIVLIIIISAVSSGGDSDTSSNEPKEEVKEKKKDAPKKEINYGIGDVVKVGDLEYTIKEKKEADQVGPSVLPEKASGKFVVLEVSLKNKGNEAVTADASFFKLKRGEKVYEADSAASISANQGEDGQIENSFFLQEVNPDSEAAGKVVFDVAPEVADASDLKVQVQTGVFGTETETITLK
ncbi:DUF4352 domain-containing protein [Peribacillus frigoritolerans]|uniref:DUF4352 domain-containing protein n=1 Tax=Peribacillus frigoritolerans TaxID=450367 RepID=UPI0024BFBFB2|nr:DUF4352 domain-containing protein [Peribacillus frigoritolerans]WHY15767.1 DUF4352 domain-containing protein [Peribacillus frigoritolerans]